MKKTEVIIKHHGRENFGIYYKPDGTDKYPMVIFSHGYNGTWKDLDEYAEPLAQRGIGCICYDFCGGSVNSKSSMDTSQMTIFTEKEDLFAVFEEVRGWNGVDTEHIFLFGESQGGLVSALAAAELKEKICGMILLYPALCIPDDWTKKYPKSSDIPEILEFWEMKLGREYIATIQGFDVFSHIKEYFGPVHIIHGTSDDIVPVSYSEKAAQIYSNAEITIIDGERHGFAPENCKKVLEITESFIMDKLK